MCSASCLPASLALCLRLDKVSLCAVPADCAQDHNGEGAQEAPGGQDARGHQEGAWEARGAQKREPHALCG